MPQLLGGRAAAARLEIAIVLVEAAERRRLVWLLVALGLAVVVVRRRSVAVALVTAQALALTAPPSTTPRTRTTSSPAPASTCRPCCWRRCCSRSSRRTRETTPVRARSRRWRAAAAIAFALALTWLVPAIGLESRDAERAVLAVAFGIVTAALRRATLFQILGIVLVENGLAFPALELPGGASVAIELGVALDLMLVALVAAVFHERIFAEFGAGDTAAEDAQRGRAGARGRPAARRSWSC